MAQPNFTLGQILTSPEMNQLADMVLYPIAVSASTNPLVAGGAYIVTTGASALTMTLPAPGVAGNIIAVKKADNTAGTITINSGIYGDFLGPGIPASTTTIQISAVGASITLLCDGSNWHVVAGAQDTGWLPIPTYTNSWFSSSGPATGGTVAGYRVTGDVVRLGGIISGGTTGTLAFTLPATAYPARNLTLMSADTSTPTICKWVVGTTGACIPTFTAGALPALDLLTWTTD
jgi:hypothetical protein